MKTQENDPAERKHRFMKEQGIAFDDHPVKLKYGSTNTYLVGSLLIDTDMPGTLPALRRELKAHGIPSERIRYVLVTHYHPDHMGLVGELIQSGVKLLLPAHQTGHVHSSDAILTRDKHSAFIPVDEQKALVIAGGESRTFLAGIGIAGEIVATKSHSPDGAALILDDGNAFVGDLEPREFLDGYDDNRALREDWDMILSRGAKIIRYGHANEQQISE